MMKTGGERRFEWLSACLTAVAFVACFAAFVWQLFVYQRNVHTWSETDLMSRAELAAQTLDEPLRTLDFKAIQKVADQLKSDGLRLRITQGRFFVSEGDGLNGFFDTNGEPYSADVPCVFKVAQKGDFFIGVGRPSVQMLMPFLGALLVIVLAGLVGMAGVLLFFIVLYRQRVRIRELARLEKFRREFVADVSHEVKTPLTGILGAADMLEEGNPLAAMIKKEANRLNGLVQSILDLARLEREGQVLERGNVDLVGLVCEAVETQRLQAEKANVSLTFSSSDETLEALADGQLVQQAVSNLIANAIRHSGSSEVIVRLAHSGQKATVSVEDHGVGIPPEHAAQVFERFHRVDPARAAETGGAGLGLAIVRRIARLHGGDVTLSSAHPHGAVFSLTFPLVG